MPGKRPEASLRLLKQPSYGLDFPINLRNGSGVRGHLNVWPLSLQHPQNGSDVLAFQLAKDALFEAEGEV